MLHYGYVMVREGSSHLSRRRLWVRIERLYVVCRMIYCSKWLFGTLIYNNNDGEWIIWSLITSKSRGVRMCVSFVMSSVCLSRGNRLTPRTDARTLFIHFWIEFIETCIQCLCIALKWNWTGVGTQSKPFVKLTSSSTITISIKLSVAQYVTALGVQLYGVGRFAHYKTRIQDSTLIVLYVSRFWNNAHTTVWKFN